MSDQDSCIDEDDSSNSVAPSTEVGQLNQDNLSEDPPPITNASLAVASVPAVVIDVTGTAIGRRNNIRNFMVAVNPDTSVVELHNNQGITVGQ